MRQPLLTDAIHERCNKGLRSILMSVRILSVRNVLCDQSPAHSVVGANFDDLLIFRGAVVPRQLDGPHRTCTRILHGLEVRDRTSAPSPSTLSISPDILSIELDSVLRCNVARCSLCNILCDTRANIAGESDPRRPTINRTLNGLEV